jgi:hypothetical protein
MPAPSQDQEFQRRMSWYFFVLNAFRFVLLIMVELLTDHQINFLFIISSDIYS